MPSDDPARFRLTLLGPWDLVGPDGRQVRSVLAQPKRLCLLAYLALGAEPVSRSTLVAVFWPDRDEERARNALSQSLHYLRRSLSAQAVESVEGDRVVVPRERVRFDARALLEGGADGGEGAAREATRAEIRAMARRVLDGHDFFEGWNAEDSQPLQQWLDEVRRQARERAEEVAAAVGDDGSSGSEEDPADGGGFGESDPKVHEGSGEAAGEVAGSGRWSRPAWVGGGVALGALLTLFVMGDGDVAPAPGPTIGEPAEVAVLLPRVTVLEGEPAFPSEAFAAAVHEEVLARLGSTTGAEIVSVPFESEVAQLVRSLEAQGSTDLPEWVVSISVYHGVGRARVIGLLLQGPDYTEARSVSARNYPVPTGVDALLELPRRIAADVVEGLGGVVGGS